VDLRLEQPGPVWHAAEGIAMDGKERIDLQHACAVATEAAEAAGALLRSRASKPFEVHDKGTQGDLVTDLDLASEAEIVARLRRAFPHHRILSEELGELPGSGPWTWLVDPLDGTNNVAIGLGVFAVGIALCRAELPMVAAVHDVPAAATWSARRGGGAWGPRGPLPTRRPAVGRPPTLSWIQGHDLPRADPRGMALKVRLECEAKRVLHLWAPLLCWVMLARGDIDGIVAYQADSIDLQAGLLIAQESGVEVRNLDGDLFDGRCSVPDERVSLVAGTPETVEWLLGLVAGELEAFAT
jgi:myo-inositol-1(or 4)-monophosphatase